jgi:hypothetical protein
VKPLKYKVIEGLDADKVNAALVYGDRDGERWRVILPTEMISFNYARQLPIDLC